MEATATPKYEGGHLTEACGPHCGVVSQPGTSTVIVAHCGPEKGCLWCHDGRSLELDKEFPQVLASCWCSRDLVYGHGGEHREVEAA